MTRSTSVDSQHEYTRLLRAVIISCRLVVDSSAQQARATTCSTRSTGCLIEAFPVEPDGHCRSRMNPHAIALSTPRIVSGMRLGSASARARAPSRSLSARSQASVESSIFLVGALKRTSRGTAGGWENPGLSLERALPGYSRFSGGVGL